MEVPTITKKGLVVGIAILVIIGIGAYLLFIRDNGGDNGGGGGGSGNNRSPVADAGRDFSVTPGELFYLNGSSSSDPDGDLLKYYWDMDIGTDSNNDGIFDNDRNREGVNISFTYPITIDVTTEFIVTLNVTEDKDDSLWDHSTVTIRVVVEEEPLPPPEVTLSCSFVTPPFGLPGEPQFVVTVSSATSDEFISNYSYRVENIDGESIREGEIVNLVNLSQNAEMRFFDTPLLTLLDGNTDSFTLKENQDIIENCVFILIYNDIRSGPFESGSVVLTK